MAGRSRRPTEEQEFLASYDATQFERLSLAVDVAVVTVAEDGLKALLLRRDEHPHLGRWALPGGFVRPDESLDAAAARVLQDKGGLKGVYLEQLYTFGAPKRDPRTRVVSVAYYALVHPGKMASLALEADADQLATIEVPWAGETGGAAYALDAKGRKLTLAFDHADILGLVVLRLRGKLDYAGIGFELLPPRFTLRQLQAVYETILARPMNKDSFRRRILASGRVVATGRQEAGVGHRPAALYRFSRKV
jgi:8-oxo-dGTP diphosphatase